MRRALLASALLLSGCGLGDAIGMAASGIADGTKYVVRQIEGDPEPAAAPPGPAAAPASVRPDGVGEPAITPVPLAPVTESAP